MGGQKNTFKLIFASGAILLLLLPPFAALNSILTHWLDTSGWYHPIQDHIVPLEARLVSAAISLVGIKARVVSGNPLAALYMVKQGTMYPLDLEWNCLGWQSALLLVISLIAGLRGKFSFFSRVKCLLFGLLGTLLINVFRMSIIASLIYYVSSFAGYIIHDYFAAFITLVWLVFFWWFSYGYLLESIEG
jgi:exosortase/archaeosortase family protein